MVMVDARGSIVLVNAHLERIFGYGRDELVGQCVERLIPSRYRERHAAHRHGFFASPASRAMGAGRDLNGLRKDGSEVPIEIGLNPLVIHGETFVLGSVVDITQRREQEREQRALERRVERAERIASVGTMAAGIAHEVNNPLAAIVGNLAFVREELVLAKQDVANHPEVSKRIEDCLGALVDAGEAAERVQRIGETMRWFSHKSSGRTRVIDLRDAVEGVLAFAENTLRHKAKLVRAYGEAPPVEMDESQLSQVLTNLLANAADAIVDGRQAHNEIRIVTRADDVGRAVVEIHDTGRGIAKSDLTRVFDPFYTTKGVGGGMGLGLALCHAFVTSAGGDIDVVSSPGATMFRVTLPAARPKAVEPSTVAVSRSSRRAKVLVLDDDATIAAAVVRVLRGHDVTVEHDARAALAKIESGATFDVFLCDLMMPNISGIEVYDVLETIDRELASRMVFLTGGAVSPEASAFLARTDLRVVFKPFDPEALRALVVEVADGLDRRGA
jgi:PAS domain S-box-containing protein